MASRRWRAASPARRPRTCSTWRTARRARLAEPAHAVPPGWHGDHRRRPSAARTSSRSCASWPTRTIGPAVPRAGRRVPRSRRPRLVNHGRKRGAGRAGWLPPVRCRRRGARRPLGAGRAAACVISPPTTGCPPPGATTTSAPSSKRPRRPRQPGPGHHHAPVLDDGRPLPRPGVEARPSWPRRWCPGRRSPPATRCAHRCAGHPAAQPWFANLGKRQVRSPKVYVRDSGALRPAPRHRRAGRPARPPQGRRQLGRVRHRTDPAAARRRRPLVLGHARRGGARPDGAHRVPVGQGWRSSGPTGPGSRRRCAEPSPIWTSTGSSSSMRATTRSRSPSGSTPCPPAPASDRRLERDPALTGQTLGHPPCRVVAPQAR